jgi:hypothetical protein
MVWEKDFRLKRQATNSADDTRRILSADRRRVAIPLLVESIAWRCSLSQPQPTFEKGLFTSDQCDEVARRASCTLVVDTIALTRRGLLVATPDRSAAASVPPEV